MRVVKALGEGQLQQLVALCRRLVYHVRTDFAGVIRKFFKFCYFQLNTKWYVVHFKCPGDLAVGDKFMENAIGLKYHVSFGVACFKKVAAVLFTFQFQHFRPHPLLNELGF